MWTGSWSYITRHWVYKYMFDKLCLCQQSHIDIWRKQCKDVVRAEEGCQQQTGCVYLQRGSMCFAMWTWPSYPPVSVSAQIRAYTTYMQSYMDQHAISPSAVHKVGKVENVIPESCTLFLHSLPPCTTLLPTSLAWWLTSVVHHPPGTAGHLSNTPNSLLFILPYSLTSSISFHFHAELIFMCNPLTASNYVIREEWNNPFVLRNSRPYTIRHI